MDPTWYDPRVTLPPITFPPALPPKSKSQQLISMLLGAVAGAVVAIFFLRFIHYWGVVLLVWIPAVIIHEFGHAIGGRIAGYRLLMMWLGPLHLVREEERWRVGFSWRYFFRGATLSAPDRWNGDAAARRELFWYVAGGSLANYIAGVALLFVPNGAVRIIAAMSILAGILSWVPSGASDGALLRQLFGSDADAIARRRMIVLGLLTRHVVPAEWPPELIQTLESESAKETTSLQVDVIAYLAALDRRDIATAQQFLQRAVNAAATPLQVAGLAMEAAIHEATWRGDADNATACLAKASSARKSDAHGALLAEAAIALARGDAAGGRRLLDEARAKATEAETGLRRTTIAELERQAAE